MSDDILKKKYGVYVILPQYCRTTTCTWNFATGGSTGEPATYSAGRYPVCRGGETADNHAWAGGSTGGEK